MGQYTNKKDVRKVNKRLDLILLVLGRPIEPTSINESKYPIIFVDDYSGLIVFYFLKNKSQAADATEKVLADMTPNGLVKRLRIDNGTEFTCSKI